MAHEHELYTWICIFLTIALVLPQGKRSLMNSIFWTSTIFKLKLRRPARNLADFYICVICDARFLVIAVQLDFASCVVSSPLGFQAPLLALKCIFILLQKHSDSCEEGSVSGRHAFRFGRNLLSNHADESCGQLFTVRYCGRNARKSSLARKPTCKLQYYVVWEHCNKALKFYCKVFSGETPGLWQSRSLRRTSRTELQICAFGLCMI